VAHSVQKTIKISIPDILN